MKRINVGLIGTGFSASLHAEAYKKVYGIDVCLRSIASVDSTIKSFAERYHIKQIYSDYQEILHDQEIDVVDICTPPFLHAAMIEDTIMAGKHIICEKPLTGYFGQDSQPDRTNRKISKRLMLEQVVESMDRLRKKISAGDGLFMYAENFIYAPSIAKSVEIIQASRASILFMKGEESHSGSHAGHAAHWKYNGGGSLIRQGCHPLSAILYLKKIEAAAKGTQVSVQSVIGDMGVTTTGLDEKERQYIVARPVDVEDCANVILTFSDGTKANIVANDMVLGGTRNSVEIYTNYNVHLCNIAPNNQMLVYNADERGLDQVYFTEKINTKSGWQNVFLDEEITRGYVGELQDFMECVVEKRQPKSDFNIAYDTLKVIYGAYTSHEEGVRVNLS